MILNDKNYYRVLIMKAGYKLTITSLSQFHMDFTIAQKYLCSLLKNKCSLIIPVSLTFNYTCNILALAQVNEATKELVLSCDSGNRTEPNSLDIPEDYKLVQVLIIFSLFSLVNIIQGSIKNKAVINFISSYYSLARVWISAVYY